MKNKLIKLLNFLIEFILNVLLSVSLIFKGICREENVLIFIAVFLVIIILFLFKYFLKPYKLTNRYLLYFIFAFTFWISLIFGKSYDIKATFINALLMLLTVLLAIVISEQYKNKKEQFFKTIIFSTFMCSLISFSSVFLDLNIINYLGDFYPSSVDRLYGTLYYPNILALMNIIGVILSFHFLNKNKIYFLTFYVNLLVFFLTISKSLIIYLIFALIVFLWKNRDKIIYLLAFLPLVYNIKMYRICYYNNNLILFIIITIICILISVLLIWLFKKNKCVCFVLISLFIGFVTLFSYQNLNVYTDKIIMITDFMYLKENTVYKISIDISGDIKDGDMYVYNCFIQNNEFKIYGVAKAKLSENMELSFNTGQISEYFALAYDSDNSKISIDSVVLESENSNEKKEIILNYKYYPYSYIKSFEHSKYDVGSLQGRRKIYNEAINIIKEQPFSGHGFGYYRAYTFNNAPIYRTLEEHSYILTLGVENGIVSILVWIILVTYISYLILRNIKDKYGVIYFLIIFAILYNSLYDFSLSYKWFLLVLFSFSMFLENKKNKELLLICSAGGHLTAMKNLESIYTKKDYILITEKTKLSKDLKNYEYLIYCSKHYFLHYIFVAPFNIVKNLFYFLYYQPKVIVSTGSHTGVLMCYIGKIFRRKVIFIEVYDRYKTLTLSGKMVYKIADVFIVQHKQLIKKYPKAIYIGGMY